MTPKEARGEYAEIARRAKDMADRVNRELEEPDLAAAYARLLNVWGRAVQSSEKSLQASPWSQEESP